MTKKDLIMQILADSPFQQMTLTRLHKFSGISRQTLSYRLLDMINEGRVMRFKNGKDAVYKLVNLN